MFLLNSSLWVVRTGLVTCTFSLNKGTNFRTSIPSALIPPPNHLKELTIVQIGNAKFRHIQLVCQAKMKLFLQLSRLFHATHTKQTYLLGLCVCQSYPHRSTTHRLSVHPPLQGRREASISRHISVAHSFFVS